MVLETTTSIPGKIMSYLPTKFISPLLTTYKDELLMTVELAEDDLIKEEAEEEDDEENPREVIPFKMFDIYGASP